MFNELDGIIINGLSTAAKSLLSKIPGYGLTMSGIPVGHYVTIPIILVVGWGVFHVILASNPKLKEKMQNGSMIANVLTFGGLALAIIILAI